MKKIFSIVLILVLLMSLFSFVFAEEKYYVQVGAFESKYKAEKYTTYMTKIGYEAVTIKVFDLYKVFLGPYESEERAREILSDYKSVGGSGFFVLGSKMYYKTEPKKEVVIEETVEEETVEETTEAVVEETTEEATTETTEESTEEMVEETVEPITVDETEDKLEVKVVEQEESEKKNDYKLFTIILIVVLWVLFVIIIVIYRLNQNKSSIE